MACFVLGNSEIAELMAVKSKHGAGGEYTPDWMPKVRCPCPTSLATANHVSFYHTQQAFPPGFPEAPPPPALEDAPREPAPPAWRTIVKHEPRKKKPKTPQPPAITAGPSPVAPQPSLPTWAQWKRTCFCPVRHGIPPGSSCFQRALPHFL